MSNLERDKLLSDLEFERLMNRSKESHTRATNDGRVKRKLSAWLKNIDDVFFIMQKLPENQLNDVFDEKDIDKLYSIIGEAMKIKKVIVKDLPLYKGVWSYGNHGVAPVSQLMSQRN